MKKEIILKTNQPYFNDIWNKRKDFEIRLNDRNFHVNDKLILKEHHKFKGFTNFYITAKIKYILRKHDGLKKGYVILGLKEIENCYWR